MKILFIFISAIFFSGIGMAQKSNKKVKREEEIVCWLGGRSFTRKQADAYFRCDTCTWVVDGKRLSNQEFNQVCHQWNEEAIIKANKWADSVFGAMPKPTNGIKPKE